MAHRNPALGLAASLCLLGCGFSSAPGAWGSEPPQVQVETLLRGDRSWDGSLLPPYGPGQPEVTILRVTIPPGLRLEPHRHPLINAGVLLQGRLQVHAEGGRSILLEAGQPLIELVNRTHYGESLGPEPAVILVVYAGVKGQPLSVPAPGF
ncbi:MAG: cupin domain-containing protein [Prochlorococcaceae cyanobacterium]|jgi:quercetin dioxygenase-like cupin family protein